MRVKQPEPFDPNREYSPGGCCELPGDLKGLKHWNLIITEQLPG